MTIERVTAEPGDLGLDEIVAENASVHVERLSGCQMWLTVESGGRRVSVWLTSIRKIHATIEDTGAPDGSDAERSRIVDKGKK